MKKPSRSAERKMKPVSTPKGRSKALSDFISSTADRSLELLKRFAAESRARGMAHIVRDGTPAGEVPGAAYDELDLASLAAVRTGWDSLTECRLNLACELLWLNARFLDAVGAPKVSSANYVADSGATELIATTWAAFLYAHSGIWERAAWLGRYLNAHFQDPQLSCVSNAEDPEFANLFRLLTQALTEGAWPSHFPDSLGPYARWLQQRNNPAAAESALEAILDLRMARYFAYREVNDPRPRRQTQDSFVMESFICAAMPADLWAIQAMTRRFDNMNLTLSGTHPWLAAPFMQPPPEITVGAEDDLTRALRAAGDEMLPPGWAG